MDSSNTAQLAQVAQTAQADFDRARRKAFLNELASTMSGRPNWLLSFDEVQRSLRITGQYYGGVQHVPVSQIVGSVDRYHVLLEHISAHRWYMGIERHRPIEWEEAVLDWYDHIYCPLVKIIEENHILADFPGRTAGDLYLWIMDHRWYLREDTGVDIGPHTAALSYDAQYGSWTRKVVRFLLRLRQNTTRPLV